MLYKRLDNGKSQWPRNETEARLLTEQQTRWMFTEINFEKWRKYGIIGVMKNNGITEYFEEVEITKEYDVYYYSVSEAITIV